jgi:hypothetical protein
MIGIVTAQLVTCTVHGAGDRIISVRMRERR